MDRIGGTAHTEVRSVLFTPGARTAWHRHPSGQVLHVTRGAAWFSPGAAHAKRSGPALGHTPRPGDRH